MYDAMVVFLKGDVGRDSWKRLLPPLLVCGVFTGLGIAAKWTAAYGALGLAGLFFGKLAFTLWEARRRGEDVRPLVRKCLQLCAWCCLFFIAIPFGIYFAAFLPITTLSHNGGKLGWAFWNYQTTMFNYHAHLEATHSFASPWYEWPFDIRPIWYFAQDNWNGYSTISSFGNPCCGGAASPPWQRPPTSGGRSAPAGRRWCWRGFGSVYLPWVLVPRLTFIYHYFTAVPFWWWRCAGCSPCCTRKAPLPGGLPSPGDWSARAPRCCWRPLPQGACCCSRCTSRCSPAPPPPGNMPTPWSCLIAGISVEKEPRESKRKVFGPLVCRLGRLLGNVPLGRNSPFSKGLRGVGQGPTVLSLLGGSQEKS